MGALANVSRVGFVGATGCCVLSGPERIENDSHGEFDFKQGSVSVKMKWTDRAYRAPVALSALSLFPYRTVYMRRYRPPIDGARYIA